MEEELGNQQEVGAERSGEGHQPKHWWMSQFPRKPSIGLSRSGGCSWNTKRHWYNYYRKLLALCGHCLWKFTEKCLVTAWGCCWPTARVRDVEARRARTRWKLLKLLHLCVTTFNQPWPSEKNGYCLPSTSPILYPFIFVYFKSEPYRKGDSGKLSFWHKNLTLEQSRTLSKRISEVHIDLIRRYFLILEVQVIHL
jgi:hypothetical protein